MNINLTETLTERGGTLLMNDGGDFVAWLPVGSNFLEIQWNADNSPMLYVNPVSALQDRDIVQHINTNLIGWQVVRCNLPGVNIDSDNCIAENEK